MTPQQTFVAADQALNQVVQQIGHDQWDMPMPPEFKTRQSDHVPTLREIINYHAYDDAWIPDMVAGRTVADVGASTYDGDLLGKTPKENFQVIVTKACTAVSSLTDIQQVLHFSYGDYPASEGLWHVISFRGLRAYDLAKVIGVDLSLPPELVQSTWDAFNPRADEWRTMGVFGPAIEVSQSAPLQEKLIALTGRTP